MAIALATLVNLVTSLLAAGSGRGQPLRAEEALSQRGGEPPRRTRPLYGRRTFRTNVEKFERAADAG